MISEVIDLIKDSSDGELDLTKIQSKIGSLEDQMKKLQQIEIKVTHHFSKGVYAREIFIPKGSIVVGKIHKHQNLNIMSSGKGSIVSIDGVKIVEAPYTVVSSPGVKRAFYAYEDTVWTTIHGTDETDLEKIEETFIAKTYQEVVMLDDKDKTLLEGAK